MIKPADLDLMNDARLQQLGSLRLPLVDLQARCLSESRQLGDRLAADSAANALGSAHRPQMQNAAIPRDLIVECNGHRRLHFTAGSASRGNQQARTLPGARRRPTRVGDIAVTFPRAGISPRS